MKKLLSLVLALALICAVFPTAALIARADSGTCGDNLTWTFDPNTHALTIEGSGAMSDYIYNDPAPWYSSRGQIYAVSLPDGLTSIGNYAFSNCSNLTSVTIPEGVTSIGNYAFSYCSNLTSVTIPESVTAIGNYAFNRCSSLTFVTIPESVTSIGNYAFYYCTGLTSVTIPKNVSMMGDYAFSYCNKLISLTISEGVTAIGRDAFSYCNKLCVVKIPESVETVGAYAFYDCSSLCAVFIYNKDCVINGNKFTFQSYYNPVTLYGYVGSTTQDYANTYNYPFVDIESDYYSGVCGENGGDNLQWTFEKETGLLRITGTGNMESFGYRSAAPWVILGDQIEEISLPEGMASIGNKAFYSLTQITEVSIPDSVTRIGEYAFYYCPNLTSVTIPEGVTALSRYAFGQCSGMTSVSLPEGMTSIDYYAFYACRSLTSVTIPASVTRLYGDAFKDCNNLRATIVRNPDCWVQEKESGDLDSEEDLYLYPSTLGTKERTIVYGKHDAELENAPVIVYDRAKGRYPENYAKTYGYTFYATDVFSDVAEGKWYEIPVAWAYGKGITTGTGEGQFSPNATCTREQIVTFIWKAYDSPEPGGTELPFTDVQPKYYANAVRWAYYHEPRITSGVDDTTFGVGQSCTRAQVVTFLWNAAGKPEPTATDNPFTDVKQTDYFYKAVLWAVENGITSGVSPTSFGPKQTCTRAQVVTFLYKAVG